MKHTFVITENYQKLTQAIRRAAHRGALEAGIIFVEGHPGISKTTTVEQVAVNDKDAVYLRAKQGYTPRTFMRELAYELAIDTACRSDELFKRCLSALAHRKDAKLVIDEVQHCLADGAAVLEKIRDFSDMTGMVVVLVAGKEDVWTRVGRYPQIASRVCEVVRFDRASERDIRAVCDALAEVKIENDLVKRIHLDSKGLMRLVMNAIANVEQIAKTNGLAAVSAKDCAQFALCVNLQSRKVDPFDAKP